MNRNAPIKPTLHKLCLQFSGLHKMGCAIFLRLSWPISNSLTLIFTFIISFGHSNRLVASRFCRYCKLFASFPPNGDLMVPRGGCEVLDSLPDPQKGYLRYVYPRHKFTGLYWQTDRNVDLCQHVPAVTWFRFKKVKTRSYFSPISSN